MPVYEKLRSLYPDGEIPEEDGYQIRKQVEEQVKGYQIAEEEIEVALAIVKPLGFDKEEEDGRVLYTTEIVYHKDREPLLLRYEKFKELNKRDFAFHYTPYNFDSNPEADFLKQVLVMLNEDPNEIEDFYFTGALTDPTKTDFLFEYKGRDDRWHTYTPDFLIRKKNGRVLIVEIKGERFRDDAVEGEKGLKALKLLEIQGLNPDRLKYEILFTKRDEIGFTNLSRVKKVIYESEVSKDA